jgi:hypothetical protein
MLLGGAQDIEGHGSKAYRSSGEGLGDELG